MDDGKTAPLIPARSSRHRAHEILTSLTQPNVAVMFALGFGSGLPFLLIGNTLGYWLREGGVALAAIGFLSWAGMAYSFKFLVGAVVDRLPPPFLSRLGRRRGWMLWTQGAVAVGLLGMAALGPRGHALGPLAWLGVMAVATGISAASQDVVIDAWRIEVAATPEELGLLTSAYSIAFRIAMIATDSWILYLAAVAGYVARFGLDGEALERRALQWAQLRGGRSGRVAFQFVRDLAGEQGHRLPL